MPFQDNQIDITDLKTVSLTIADIRALIIILECATSHLLLPDEATAALDRLRAAIDRR
jgi:hypothetical protein